MREVIRLNKLVVVGAALLFCLCAGPGAAQPVMDMNMDMTPGWKFMQDGVLFAEFNHQGGARGGNDVIAPNWWMGMAGKSTSHGQIAFSSMFSLEPATVGKSGYRELFQAGEALGGRPLIDRQHPHDLFMQLAAVWRVPVGSTTGLTLAGAPAGEAALGPVAFMHRASAMDNPIAPLSHHTFDSTHVSFGVVTAAVDHGPWMLEGSVFNGREPDENRWDFDFGRLDSYSGRLSFRPNAEWEFQASTGRLKNPEQLEPGIVDRSTASVSWTKPRTSSLSSVTVAYGRNNTDHGARSAFLAEGAHRSAANTIYARIEALQTETALLQTDAVIDGAAASLTSPLAAFTVGAVHDILHLHGFEGGVGADVSAYGVPASLTPFYGAHPLSFHVFFRLRPPAGKMGRMWNMRMSEPMAGRPMRM